MPISKAATRSPAAAPPWLAAALAVEPERARVTVDGVSIESLAWGERGRPGLMLVHGSRAQADWWSVFAPFFLPGYRVAACSLSGMGRSGWRDRYSTRVYGREILAVAEATGLFEAAAGPVLLAHSFGGLALVHAALEAGPRLRGAIFADTLLRQPPAGARDPAITAHKVYPTWEAARARFRLFPPQATDNPFLLDLIARQMIIRGPDGEGWTWNYDPGFLDRLTWHDEESLLDRVACPVAILRGAESPLLTEAVVADMLRRLPPGAPAIEIPAAGHHLFLDQPIAAVVAVRTLLAAWARPS